VETHGREYKPYLSVRLDSPFLAAPVNAALIEQQDCTYAPPAPARSERLGRRDTHVATGVTS
jgi:hypothetical protein